MRSVQIDLSATSETPQTQRMVQPADLQQLEKDFLSGKNPLAYIPLCIALRRQKQFARALEVCQRGLGGDPSSLAGRTLLARLLSDLGHYEDALKEIVRAEAFAPEANGLMVEKARCMIRLKRVEEAEAIITKLDHRNPMDPQVQLLNNQLRQLRTHAKGGTTHGVSRDEVPRFVRMTNREIMDLIKRELRGHAAILSLAVIPMGAGEPALEGDATVAESAYQFWKEGNVCCQELDCGRIKLGILETDKMQMFVLVKRQTLLALCIQPSPNIGKIYHRFLLVAGQLIPDALQTTG
ncbi:tetratricopeptide repeat protein [bacterium]|nr:tetratricopeptide repeat protein [bacterium]